MCEKKTLLRGGPGFYFMHHRRWDAALFLHFSVDPALLQAQLPRGLLVDLYQGVAIISVVALSECGIEPRLPLLPRAAEQLLALTHHAVNVRTYVRPADGRGPPGVYFFTLDCSSLLPAVGARLLLNLPYRLAGMSRTPPPEAKGSHEFRSVRRERTLLHREPPATLHARWTVEGVADEAEAGSLAEFAVERYCVYCERGLLLRCVGLACLSRQHIWRGDIQHAPWPLQHARVQLLENTMLHALGFGSAEPFAAHFSSGVSAVDFFFLGSRN